MWFFRILGLVKLYAVVNIAQDSTDAVLIGHVQLEVVDHAEAFDQASHSAVKSSETSTLHHLFLLIGSLRFVVLGLGTFCNATRALHRVIVEETYIGGEEAFEVLLLDLPLNKIHLGENVDVRHLKHEHSTHSTESTREKLGAINDERGFEEIDSGHADIEGTWLGEELDQGG
ncbi:hypothetical protein HG530_004734 [Fusarium avenaceum]|nr:hypothetical protein HG530_004734 [Fusarium avenaceum]